MSDSESDGFLIADDSGSEDFAPAAPKAKKAAPAKKAAASTSKVTKVRTYFTDFRQSSLITGSRCKESPGKETTTSCQEECSQRFDLGS